MDVSSQNISQIIDLSHEHANFVVSTQSGGISVVIVYRRSYRRPKVFIKRIGIARSDLSCRIFRREVSSNGLQKGEVSVYACDSVKVEQPKGYEYVVVGSPVGLLGPHW